MGFVSTGGITKLSQLIIDANKDWQTKGISNLKELALGMIQGDILVHDGTRIIRLPPGVANTVLTSGGAGVVPSWQAGGLYLARYIPATIGLSKALALVSVDQAIPKNAILTSEHKQAYDDQPADMIIRGGVVGSILASVDTETIVAVDQAIPKNAPIRSDLSILVDGFVEETAAGVQTDHTSQAKSSAAGDLNLCPMVPTVLDKIYIGSYNKFWRVWMNYSQAGAGNWTNVAYYWNGAWVACVGEEDQTSDFTAAAGIRRIDHTPQGDWATHAIMGYTLYWMMIRTDTFNNQSVKPLGSQIFVSIA